MNLRRLFGAGAICAALAAALLQPREAAGPPPSAPSGLRLDQRLSDAGWRLIETRERGPDRREPAAPPPPTRLFGGLEAETPSWFALVRAVHPFPGGLESRSECGGALYEGGFVVTAAHCVLDRDGSVPLRIEICVEPWSRSACRASFAVHHAAVDLNYEPDGAAGYREDRALLRLPEDPGGGAVLPQTARAEVEPGEIVHVFAMGLTAGGGLAERVSRCAQPVVDVRRTIVETRAESCRIRRADSGSPAGRETPSGEIVPLLIVSSYDSADETRNFFAPLRPERIRAAIGAFLGETGAAGEIRTLDLSLTKGVLYP